MKCSGHAGVWLDSCLLVLGVVVICPGFVRMASGDYVIRDSNDWLADELNLPNDPQFPSASGNSSGSPKSSNKNVSISLQTAGEYTNVINRSAASDKPLTAILLAENITAKTGILAEDISDTVSDVDDKYDAKHYRISSASSPAKRKKYTSTQQRRRIFSEFVSSAHRSSTMNQTTISENPADLVLLPSQPAGSTKPVFWDYGDKDDVQPADYDYQAVLKDQPESSSGCYGFLRLRRNCRGSYGNLGLMGALAVGFCFVLVLLLCACKGCRCVQVLMKKRLRYLRHLFSRAR